MSNVIQNRYDFVLLFDCTNSNPNGDPDAGNQPRIDPQTGKCLVTDGCIKRKIRNEVSVMKDGESGFKMYIEGGDILNNRDNEAFLSIGCDPDKVADFKKGHPDVDNLLRDFMCGNYYDIRTFGAVMTKFQKASLSCAGVRGPVHISFAESVSPVEMKELSITRITTATQEEFDKHEGTFGQKFIIPYGLFLCTGGIDPMLAQKFTGFSEDDLDIFWKAVLNMFEHDRSAARPQMAVRKLIIFKHDSAYGNARKEKLVERVKVVEKNPGSPIRSYDDYTVSIDKSNLPSGVTITVMD